MNNDSLPIFDRPGFFRSATMQVFRKPTKIAATVPPASAMIKIQSEEPQEKPNSSLQKNMQRIRFSSKRVHRKPSKPTDNSRQRYLEPSKSVYIDTFFPYSSVSNLTNRVALPGDWDFNRSVYKDALRQAHLEEEIKKHKNIAYLSDENEPVHKKKEKRYEKALTQPARKHIGTRDGVSMGNLEKRVYLLEGHKKSSHVHISDLKSNGLTRVSKKSAIKGKIGHPTMVKTQTSYLSKALMSK